MSSIKMKERYFNVACPICGELPKIHALTDFNEYKVTCPRDHLNCGDWKSTKLEAYRDWLRRIKDTSQPDFCYNDNHFTIGKMNVDEMADFLYRWQKDAVSIMCKECGEHIAGVPTIETIKKWLAKPVDGVYPKGYPGVPKELQSTDTDIYGYRKRQAAHKI